MFWNKKEKNQEKQLTDFKSDFQEAVNKAERDGACIYYCRDKEYLMFLFINDQVFTKIKENDIVDFNNNLQRAKHAAIKQTHWSRWC